MLINLSKNDIPNVFSKSIETTRKFYKENGKWYIDLPEFLELNLGTKENLLMVGGSDTFLDKLSKNGDEVTIHFSNISFTGYQDALYRTKLGFDEEYLQEVGHPVVDGGAYYKSSKDGHQLWLCPVTKFVFSGDYPQVIYIQVVE
jgi:hypothetical protein